MDITIPSIQDILAQKIQDIQSRLPVSMNVAQTQTDTSFASELSDAMGTGVTGSSATTSQTGEVLQAAVQSMLTGNLLGGGSGDTDTGNASLSGLLGSLTGNTAYSGLTGGTTASSQFVNALTAALQGASGSSAASTAGTTASGTGATTGWPRLTAAQLEAVMPRIDAAITKSAQANGLDPKLLRALIKQESSFQPFCLSSAGAMGLTQLMPGTAQGLGVSDPYDIESNIEGGARYLAAQLETFGGDLSLALAAYNAGPNAVRASAGIPPYAETKDFVNKVVGYYNTYRAAAL